jgi:predicted anti-sigma-YlaC factor YlaD
MRIRGQTCDRAREWASLRLDGELSELESALLDAHLKRCDACRAFAAEVDSIALALRAAPLERLEQPVVLPLRRRARTLRVVQVGVAAALVAAAAGLGTVFGTLGTGTHTSARPVVARLASADLLAANIAEQARGLPLYPPQDFMRRKGLLQAGTNV